MILNILYCLRTLLIHAKTSSLSNHISNEKNEQLEKFDNIKGKFLLKYKKIAKKDESSHLISTWSEKNKQLRKIFLPYPTHHFLRNQIILRTMFVASGGKLLSHELKFLEQEISSTQLKQLTIVKLV